MEANGDNSNSSSNPDNEWKPPTEAEKKVLLAKRERSDKISKRMAEYLLKGKYLSRFSMQAYGHFFNLNFSSFVLLIKYVQP